MIPHSGSGTGRGAGMGEFPLLPRLKPPSAAGLGRLPSREGWVPWDKHRALAWVGPPVTTPSREQDGIGGWDVSPGQSFPILSMCR